MSKVERLKQDTANSPEFVISCPGCKCCHWFKTTGKEPRWSFNGDMENPTINPSLLVRSSNANGPTVCHSFIKDGNIQFLNDCTHDMAGKTVPLDET